MNADSVVLAEEETSKTQPIVMNTTAAQRVWQLLSQYFIDVPLVGSLAQMDVMRMPRHANFHLELHPNTKNGYGQFFLLILLYSIH